MAQLDGAHLIFVDESGLAPGQHLAYGYAPCGERCVEAAPLRPSGRLNIVGWMGSCRGEALMEAHGEVSREGPLDACGEAVMVAEKMTGVLFERFVSEYLVPALEPGDIVFWDNARIHTQRAVELVESAGARVIALPRYSPDLNAIEHFWSKLKHYVRKLRADTGTALREALVASAERITSSDMLAWMKHCGYSINVAG